MAREIKKINIQQFLDYGKDISDPKKEYIREGLNE